MKTDIKTKICGMRDPENIQEIGTFMPDYMGFIEYPLSPRFVGMNFDVPSGFPSEILRIGVFVNPTINDVLISAAKNRYDFIQLHGREPVGFCDQIEGKGLKVVKVFSVDAGFNFKLTKPYVGHVDYFLFDTKGDSYGGNAKVFDWNLLKHYDQEVPFFISGGLSIENIDNIHQLDQMNLHALDFNSGVELTPGFKDVAKVSALISKMRIGNFNN